MAELGSQEDKEYLAKALSVLGKPSTGTLQGDVKALSAAIKQYGYCLSSSVDGTDDLDLGLWKI